MDYKLFQQAAGTYQDDPFDVSGLTRRVSQIQGPQTSLTQRQTTMTPNASDLFEQLKKRKLESIEAQKKGVEEFEKTIKNTNPQNATEQNIVTVLAGLSDFLSGTNNLATLQERKDRQKLLEQRNQAQLQKMREGVSSSELDLLGTQFKYLTSQEEMKQKSEMEKERLKNYEKLAQIKASQKDQGLNLTPGEKKRDEKFGSSYDQNLQTLQGSINALDGLKGVANKLGKGTGLTGPSVGATPMIIRRFSNPESVDAQQTVEKYIQGSLRETLGAQFTEKEGELLLARTYNPSLGEEYNKPRVEKLIKEAQAAIQAKQEAMNYFVNKGTLKGYAGPKSVVVGGKTYSVVDGIGDTETPVDAKMKRLEELRKKARGE